MNASSNFVAMLESVISTHSLTSVSATSAAVHVSHVGPVKSEPEQSHVHPSMKSPAATPPLLHVMSELVHAALISQFSPEVPAGLVCVG